MSAVLKPQSTDQEMLWHLCQQAISFRNRARACAEPILAGQRRADQQAMVRAAECYVRDLEKAGGFTEPLRLLYDEARAR